MELGSKWSQIMNFLYQWMYCLQETAGTVIYRNIYNLFFLIYNHLTLYYKYICSVTTVQNHCIIFRLFPFSFRYSLDNSLFLSISCSTCRNHQNHHNKTQAQSSWFIFSSPPTPPLSPTIALPLHSFWLSKNLLMNRTLFLNF